MGGKIAPGYDQNEPHPEVGQGGSYTAAFRSGLDVGNGAEPLIRRLCDPLGSHVTPAMWGRRRFSSIAGPIERLENRSAGPDEAVDVIGVVIECEPDPQDVVADIDQHAAFGERLLPQAGARVA